MESFDFELFYNDQPFFNPAIVKGGVFKGDEYDRGEKELNRFMLISVLEAASQAKKNGEAFAWSAWETEVEVDIKLLEISGHAKSTEAGDLKPFTSTLFEMSVFIGETFFVDGETNYGLQNRGAMQLLISQDQLKQFCLDLKSEMEKIDPPLFTNK
ncbi:hypothetical protein KKD88_03835 [Patescibacteria group bacterium]|nr:hypothetical protein [Patescibacteria group bacterium]